MLPDAPATTPHGLCPITRANPHPRDEPRSEVLGDIERPDGRPGAHSTYRTETIPHKFLEKHLT